MTGDAAALLTKTQRRRIREDFAELDESKTRRDQQRIRERIETGVRDFSILVNYPDEQLQMAVENCSDEELADALAGGHLVLERIREGRQIGRDDVIKRLRDRARSEAGTTRDVATLNRLEFETMVEQRHRLVSELQARLGPSKWGRRANRLLRFAGCVFLPVFVFWILDKTTGLTLLRDYPVVWVPLVWLGVPLIASAIAIKLLQTLKYDILPVCRQLSIDPVGVLSRIYNQLTINLGSTLRRLWDEL